jgi:hypothetical protein
MQNHLNNLPKKRKHFITVERKLEMISEFRSQAVSSKRLVAKNNGISTAQLRRYLAQEEKLEVQVYQRRSRALTNRKSLFEDEEKEVYEWFKTQRGARIPVAGITIQSEMKCLVDREHPELAMNGKAFMASAGWFSNFCKRMRLSRRRITTSGRPFPTNSVEVLNEWIKDLNDCIEEFDFREIETVHMDETSMYMEMPGTYIFETVGARRVEAGTNGQEKTRLSCAYSANAAGNKLDILGIIKREGAIAQMQIPDNFIPVYSSKGILLTYNY